MTNGAKHWNILRVVLTTMCWKSHVFMICVACLGRMPRLLEPVLSKSSSSRLAGIGKMGCTTAKQCAWLGCSKTLNIWIMRDKVSMDNRVVRISELLTACGHRQDGLHCRKPTQCYWFELVMRQGPWIPKIRWSFSRVWPYYRYSVLAKVKASFKKWIILTFERIR